jgi:hypothetical protein
MKHAVNHTHNRIPSLCRLPILHLVLHQRPLRSQRTREGVWGGVGFCGQVLVCYMDPISLVRGARCAAWVELLPASHMETLEGTRGAGSEMLRGRGETDDMQTRCDGEWMGESGGGASGEVRVKTSTHTTQALSSHTGYTQSHPDRPSAGRVASHKQGRKGASLSGGPGMSRP